MEHRNHRKWIFPCIILFATALLFGTPCLAAEFTADMTMNAGGQVMNGKVFVKGHKFRQDMKAMGQNQVMIFDGDKKTGWMVMPDARMYMPLPKAGPGNVPTTDQKELERKATRKYLGTENINGYKCEKYSYVFKDSPGTEMTQWISTKLQYPVKMIVESSQGRMVRELKNIKQKKVANSLFKVPAGYQKMSMPGMSGTDQ